MADFNPQNYPNSITIGVNPNGTSGFLPACSACLLQMWGAGGGGGGAPGIITPGPITNATGGGGGGGGAYGLIAVTDTSLLQGTTPYIAYVNGGGVGQNAGPPTYNGQDGGPTTLQFPSIQVNIQVSGGQGGQGGQIGPNGGQGGNGGVGAFIVSSGPTNYFQIGSSVSFGGGGGVNIAPGNSIYGATGGIGYLNNSQGGAGYNGSFGNDINNAANASNTRAGYGGGSIASRGGSCEHSNMDSNFYLNGAGSGGSVASDAQPAVGTSNGVHPYTASGAGAGFNTSQMPAHNSKPGAMCGGGGGGGVGELNAIFLGNPQVFNGAAASNGGNGQITILYKP